MNRAVSAALLVVLTCCAPAEVRGPEAYISRDLRWQYGPEGNVPIAEAVVAVLEPDGRVALISGYGARAGQFSIRINEQWRVCFAWRGGDAYDVEIVDYH